MRKKWLAVAAGLTLAATAMVGGYRTVLSPAVTSPEPAPDSLLNIPLEHTVLARQEFLKAYRSSDQQHARALYDAFLPRIGANGLREAIEAANPLCHAEAHDLGKAIFTRLRDVGASLESCADACTSGCMHGVLMQFFADSSSMGDARHDHSAQLTAAEVAERIPTFCESSAVTRMYRLGDCAHGVGHAVMFLANYEVPAGIELCERFPTYALRYYCATGAYMEYRITRSRSGASDSEAYSCEQALYPAACFRYAMLTTIPKHYFRGGTLETLERRCAALSGKYRLGCFHGLGFAHLERVAQDQMALARVCGFGNRTDQTLCIEGAMERLGRFDPAIAARRCESLTDWRREVCQEASTRKIYDLDKSFALYQR